MKNTCVIPRISKVAKARGCQFLSVDAAVQGRLGEGLGWIKLGKEFVGAPTPTTFSNDDKENQTLASRMEKLPLWRAFPPILIIKFKPNAKLTSALPPSLDPFSIHSELQPRYIEQDKR
ncbi:hypothetical protein BGX38DRAFT_1276653 [Terfezia claveryi]|nr:hypothetical protein BGX38DRAFT_1276653 [Terfezia claveryi]